MKYRSREAVERSLKKFFSNTTSNSITAEEAYIAWGRDLDNEKKNKNWLSTFLTHLKRYEYVKPEYSTSSGWRVMNGMRLTEEGRRAIGRSGGNDKRHVGINDHQESNIDLMKMVAEYRKNYPEYEVVFSVRLKDQKKVVG